RTGFALPVADAEELPLAYRTPMGLLDDLRDAAETNAVLARDGRVPPRALLPMALSRLPAGGEGIRPVLRVLTVTGWAPHESQSKPARPGSATARLADALGAEERSAGEKAGR
ncbi:MAG: SAM-dependent methyltransferase, partial [Acetobacteraceae bacterium]|nr:SAM-dependent methyltransferase [Acetobacteraceae bacterium]